MRFEPMVKTRKEYVKELQTNREVEFKNIWRPIKSDLKNYKKSEIIELYKTSRLKK